MQEDRRAELSELTVPECYSLLATVERGWVATTQQALPAVMPVRLEVVGNKAIVSSLLGASMPLVAPAVVSLAAGDLGRDGTTGWVVEVVGLLEADSAAFGAASTSDEFEVVETFTLACDRVRGWRAS